MAPRLRAPQPAHLSSLLPVASLDREIAIVNFWIKLACSYCSRTNWWLVTGDTSGSLCSPNARLATSKKIRRKTWATLLHSFGMLFRSLFETLLTHLACCFWQLPKTTAESHKFIPLPWNSCSLPGYPHHEVYELKALIVLLLAGSLIHPCWLWHLGATVCTGWFPSVSQRRVAKKAKNGGSYHPLHFLKN